MKPAKSARNNTKIKKTEKGNIQDPLFPIVGIGASAGGLEAFEQLFANMPPDIGMAFHSGSSSGSEPCQHDDRAHEAGDKT